MGEQLMAVAFPAVMAVVIAIVMSSVSKAGARGDLPRSGAVGIRTKATKLSDAAWAAGHGAAVPLTRKISLLTSVVALVIILLGITVEAGWVTAVGIVPFGVVILGMIPVVQAANAAAREAAAAEEAEKKTATKTRRKGKGSQKKRR